MLSPQPAVAPMVLGVVLFVLLAVACSETADLIPGEEPVFTADDPGATPTPVVAPPILPPGSPSVAGSSQRNAPAAAVSDAMLARSVVQLRLLDTAGAVALPVRDGSGVVIDRAQRLILTSYELVNPFLDDGTAAYTIIAVGVNRTTGGEPALEFEAEIVAASPLAQLAVLRATSIYRGGSIGVGEFDLPAVDLGDPEQLLGGDTLRLFGHPGLNASDRQAVIAVTATVTGFRGAENVDGRAWLKTDARVPYGGAGGPAFDAMGTLVGIATQLRYDPRAAVGQVRSIALAADLIEQARNAGPEARYVAPLQRAGRASPPATALEDDRVAVGSPVFAANAVEGAGGLDLFDYTPFFQTQPPALYYEYIAQAIPDGALVEERWYLDGVLQDPLSSSFMWDRGSLGIVTDQLRAPSPRGMPPGAWRLEVWVDDVLRTSRTAYVALELSAIPEIGQVDFGSSAAADHRPAEPASGEAQQLLAFFSYEHSAAVRSMRWIVFRNSQVVYRSPVLPWEGGDEGTWWVGFASDEAIGPGFWEVEIWLDGPDSSTPMSRGAGGVELF